MDKRASGGLVFFLDCADTEVVTSPEFSPPFDSYALIELATSTFGNAMASLSELSKRLVGAEREQFATDMREAMHHGIDLLIRPDTGPEDVEAFQREIMTVLEAWVISARLVGSTEWHGQVEESEAGIDSGDLSTFGDPLTAEDLHRPSA